MEKYDYVGAVKNDVLEWIDAEGGIDVLKERYSSQKRYWNGMEDWLAFNLWGEDSVTGSRSGSYWKSPWKAEDALSHNWDLMREAMDEGGLGKFVFTQGPETVDVCLRCYVLGQAIQLALEELGYEDDEDDI